MAHEDGPEQRSSAGRSESRADAIALEARVAALELEVAALQRQIAAGNALLDAARTAPAPAPPPPVPVAGHREENAGAGRRLVSQTWARVSKDAPGTGPPDALESFESRLGSQIFNRIAIVLLLIGTSYGLKLAVDRGLIGPTGRVIAGLLAGAGLVLWSERFRHKGFAAFSYSLKAVGSGVLYLSLWAAFQLFHLLPTGAALALMVLVTAWNAYMAWVQDSELLAVYALAGGFATPVLVSTGGNHEIFLFTYLLAIDVATVVLVRLKTWPRLLLGAFPITVIFFVGWYSEFYAASELAITSVFIALFGVAFASVPVGRTDVGVAASARGFASMATLLEDILLPLANAAFIALASYSVLQDSGHHVVLPWMMIVLAAVYLGVMRLPQTRTASAIHLSLAVVFLTIAIPLKASGHWITASWLVEGLALLWVATRLESGGPSTDSEESYASITLRWLASAALLLGLCGILGDTAESIFLSSAAFFSAGTATAFTGVVMFAASGWLSLRQANGVASNARGWTRIAAGSFIAIDLIALFLSLRELLDSGPPGLHAPFQTSDFALALVGLAIFGVVVAVSLRLTRAHPVLVFWIRCAAISTVAFNLIAVLTGVREVSAIWSGASDSADAGLQRALAISAFLMLYGAAILAVGFLRRSGFLRGQALVLLVFSIFKTFLYDMRSLSQGYRVVSFLGLGALLMAISFAYQKDWLNLRKPLAKQESGVRSGADADADPGASR